MSLIMTIYLNDGLVMASDSRTTLTTTQTSGNNTISNTFPFSDSSFKSFIAPNNCGIVTCGDSSYLNKPISGYIEKFLLSNVAKTTTIFDLANQITDYFTNLDSSKTTVFHVCGYELNASNEYESKLYICITGTNKTITSVSTSSQGAIWNGEIDTLTKLIKPAIVDPEIIEVPNLNINVNGNQVTLDSYVLDKSKTTILSGSSIPWGLMTIQEAIDFIRFAFETTIGNMKFQTVNKTVGGPIDILVIKPNKTKWIKRKSLI